jgi:hypothetical protein
MVLTLCVTFEKRTPKEVISANALEARKNPTLAQ